MSEEPRKKKAKVENSENLKVDFAIFQLPVEKKSKYSFFSRVSDPDPHGSALI
jgi:hypothetical protein